jgi:hypothetical protein
MTDVIADMRRQFREYCATPEFKAKAEATCARIEAGEHLDNAALAECLGVPERLVEFAMAGLIAKNAVAGADLTPVQIAAAWGESPDQVTRTFDQAFGLLLNSRSTDPDLARLMRTKQFKKAVKRQPQFIDDDITLRKLAVDLKIPVEVMSWAFFEARARDLLKARSIN